jgi:hypothetical protein
MADLPLLDHGLTGQGLVLVRAEQNPFGLLTIERREQRERT